MSSHKEIVISIDAMGGQHAPAAVIEAVNKVLLKNDMVRFLIYGDREALAPHLQTIRSDRYEFIHTSSFVSDEDKPVQALRSGNDSSMRKAIEAVKEGRANACVSAGNTGALMVMSKMVLGSLTHIKRPAIIGKFPTQQGGCVVLDLGANTDCNELHLFQFALMGSCFAKVILGKEQPRIGVLNVGSEQIKGRDLEKRVDSILKETGLNYHGFIEGHDISLGTVDVVVTDGFSGNLVLKASEGAAKFIVDTLKTSFKGGGILPKLVGAFAKPILRQPLNAISPSENNGAMFMGINGIVIKSHGGADSIGIANSIRVATELAEQDINTKIVEGLLELEEKGIGVTLIDKLKHTSAKLLGIDK